MDLTLRIEELPFIRCFICNGYRNKKEKVSYKADGDEFLKKNQVYGYKSHLLWQRFKQMSFGIKVKFKLDDIQHEVRGMVYTA